MLLQTAAPDAAVGPECAGGATERAELCGAAAAVPRVRGRAEPQGGALLHLQPPRQTLLRLVRGLRQAAQLRQVLRLGARLDPQPLQHGQHQGR